jgi:hypothetical protein
MENYRSLSRRSALGFAASAVAVPFIGGRAQAANAPVLVELFTSQGCSSCPPADKLAGKLAQRDDVIVASLNVDYWDYLGWRDTLAKKEYTQRQYDYARARGDGQVYTPQMVMNGALHAVGSNSSNVAKAIDDARALSSRVPMDVSVSASEVSINIGGDAALGGGDVWLMGIKAKVEVQIERGENSGSTVVYHNVVHRLSPAGMWKGKPEQLVMSRKAVAPHGCTSCVAVLQKPNGGEIMGLAKFPLTTS